MNKLLPLLLLAVLVSACEPQVRPDGDTALGGADAGRDNAGASVGVIGGDGSLIGTALEGKTISYEKNAINDAGNVLSIRTIYFDLDSSDISDIDTEVLKHHGKYLSLNTDARLRLEGNTDERGTREYNVALADRRAQAVKRLLLFQGAASDQITIISYGEEKPAALGHDEDAWKLNRRVELVYE
jgi:peptidoglycan-associated lipoprotein